MRRIGLAVVLAVSVSLILAPLGAAAQLPGKVWRIGVLVTLPRPAPTSPHPYNAFLRGLRNLGYVKGQNVTSWLDDPAVASAACGPNHRVACLTKAVAYCGAPP